MVVFDLLPAGLRRAGARPGGGGPAGRVGGGAVGGERGGGVDDEGVEAAFVGVPPLGEEIAPGGAVVARAVFLVGELGDDPPAELFDLAQARLLLRRNDSVGSCLSFVESR